MTRTRRVLAVAIGACLALLPVGRAHAASKFAPPLAVRDGVIRDADGREVRLWGVNYYAPFSHNYQNLAEVGADHGRAIAEDVAQFRVLGLDLVRIHVFDREITDAEGHLVENRHLRVFDQLMEELDRAGIFVVLTPVAWWNTPENQVLMDRYYAYWHLGTGASFGFSNYFGVDEMIWNEEAIRCQERYLRAHIDYSVRDPAIHAALDAAGVHAYTTGCYLTGGRGFESSWNDHLDFLDLTRQWNAAVAGQGREDRPRIIYEFNAPSTLQGYPYGAMAVAFAARRAQLAAMFTYTPTAVAAYNPGWRVHYLNLLHTPARAVAFAAAGEIFRRAPRDGQLPSGAERWQGPGWSIERRPDRVSFAGDGLLVHSGDLPGLLPAAQPASILASGSSRLVTAEGNGAYLLVRAGDRRWELTVFPNERLVNDPFRGRSFRPMANRYMNVNELPVVSRLLDAPRRFLFQLGRVSCTRAGPGEPAPIAAAPDGSFTLSPGNYQLVIPGGAP